MDEHTFKLTLPDNFLRTLNRQQYKAASQWLRLCVRKMDDVIDREEMSNIMFCGCANYAGLIPFLKNQIMQEYV